jgi:hypothetical protein
MICSDKHGNEQTFVPLLCTFVSPDPNGTDKRVVNERTEDCGVFRDCEPGSRRFDKIAEFIWQGRAECERMRFQRFPSKLSPHLRIAGI